MRVDSRILLPAICAHHADTEVVSYVVFNYKIHSFSRIVSVFQAVVVKYTLYFRSMIKWVVNNRVIVISRITEKTDLSGISEQKQFEKEDRNSGINLLVIDCLGVAEDTEWPSDEWWWTRDAHNALLGYSE